MKDRIVVLGIDIRRIVRDLLSEPAKAHENDRVRYRSTPLWVKQQATKKKRP